MKGRAPRALSSSTVARTMVAILAMPRLPAPTATASPRLMGRPAAPSAVAHARGDVGQPGPGEPLPHAEHLREGHAWIIRRRPEPVNLLDFAEVCPYLSRTHARPVAGSLGVAPPLPGAPPRRLLLGRRLGRRPLQAAAAAAPAGRRALCPGRAGDEQAALRGGAAALPQGGRAPPPVHPRAEGEVPHRGGFLPRGRVRQGASRSSRASSPSSPATRSPTSPSTDSR